MRDHSCCHGAKTQPVRPYSTTALSCLLVVAAAGVLGSSCRSAQRGMQVGADVAELKVTMTGLREGDTQRKDWIYELSTCISSPVNGELGDDGILSVKAAGLKKDMIDCQLRVKMATEAPANFNFGANADRTLLYWARTVMTSLSATGTLEATASLEPLFNVLPADQAQIFTVKVPVEWPTVEATSNVTAQLSCNPSLGSTGFYTQTGEKTGSFAFNWTNKSKTDYVCSMLVVHASSDYRSELGDAGKFKIGPGDQVELAKVTLKQAIGTVKVTSDDISIDLPKEAEKCADNERFDVNTRKCVAK